MHAHSTLLIGIALAYLAVAQDPQSQAIQAQESTCSLILTDCPGGAKQNWASLDCVKSWCTGGVLGTCDQNNCCTGNLAQAQTCLQSSSSSSTTTSQPANSNLAGCSSAASIATSCESKTPNFTALPATVIASCLCYDSEGMYQPSLYDDAVSSCYNFYQTVNITQASAISRAGLLGFCTGSAASTSSKALTSTSVQAGSSIATVQPTSTLTGTTSVSRSTDATTGAAQTTSPVRSASNSIYKLNHYLYLTFIWWYF